MAEEEGPSAFPATDHCVPMIWKRRPLEDRRRGRLTGLAASPEPAFRARHAGQPARPALRRPDASASSSTWASSTCQLDGAGGKVVLNIHTVRKGLGPEFPTLLCSVEPLSCSGGRGSRRAVRPRTLASHGFSSAERQANRRAGPHATDPCAGRADQPSAWRHLSLGVPPLLAVGSAPAAVPFTRPPRCLARRAGSSAGPARPGKRSLAGRPGPFPRTGADRT